MEKGEEMVKNHINAKNICDIINEHHLILKDLNNTGKPLREMVYDKILKYLLSIRFSKYKVL
jgi:hypothetical protein